MGTIKLRRGTGSPAGSLAQYEVAMDVAAKNLYTSTDGSDAVILSDNTENFLANAASTNNFLISGTAVGINYGTGAFGASVLNVKTSTGGWDKAQLSLEDDDDKVVDIGGSVQTGGYRSSLTLDPNNTHGRSGVTTYAGDYAITTIKNYSDPAAIQIRQNVFGANDGYILTVHDDNNTSTPNPGPFSGYGGYGYKPFVVQAEKVRINVKDSDTSVDTALVIDNTSADFRVPVELPNLTTTERNALAGAKGMTIYNTTEDRIEYYDGAWKYISGTAV